MDIKRFKIKLKDKKILLNFVLSSISLLLFISILFFSFTFLTKKYRDVVSMFGITIDDDCKLKQGMITCSYINLSGKDFNLHLKNVKGTISFKGFFNSGPVLDVSVENADAVYLNDPKAPPSEKIPGIFETYTLLSHSKLLIGLLNLKIINLEENTNLVVNIQDVKNKKNSIYAFGINLTVLKENKEIPIAVVHPERFFITVNPSSLTLKNVVLNHQNVYLSLNEVNIYENRRIKLEGSTTVKDFIYEDVNVGVLTSDFKVNFKPEKFIEVKSKGRVDKVVLLDKGAVKDITFNFDLNGRDMSDFKLKGYIKGEEGLFNNKKIGKLEFNYKATKTENDLLVDGDINTELTGIRLSLKNGLLNLKTESVSLAKLKSFIDFPEELRNVEGSLSANIKVDTSKWDVYTNLDIEKLEYNHLKNLTGKANIQYVRDGDTLNLDLSLSEKSTILHLRGGIFNLTKNTSLSLDLDAQNFNLENVYKLENLKIGGDTNIKGKIYGTLDNIKANLDGHAKSFRFEEVSLKDIDYKLMWEGGNINVNASLTDRTLTADVIIDINRDLTTIRLKADNFKADGVKDYLKKHSTVFSKVDVSTLTGKMDIQIPEKGFNINLNLSEASVSLPTSSPLKVSLDGFITDKDDFLKIYGYADKFSLENHQFEKLSLKATLKNQDVLYEFSCLYPIAKDKVSLSSIGTYNTNTTNLKVDLKLYGKVPIKDKTEEVLFEGSLAGNLESLDGAGTIKLGKTKTSIDAKLSSLTKDKMLISLITSPFVYTLDGRKVSVEGVQGRFDIDKQGLEDIKGVVKLTNFSILEKNINLVNFKEATLSVVKDRISVVSAVMDGVLKGKVDTFEYNFKNGLIKVVSNGEIDRKYLSEIFQLLNVDGSLKFSFSYSGDIKNLPFKYSLKLYGDSLRLRTPYTQNMITFKRFNLTAKDELYLDADGITKSSVGEGSLKMSGRAKPDLSDLSFDISSTNIPVKYQNIFSGHIDGKANVRLSDKSLNINLNSQITGRAKVEPDMFENTKVENGKPELIKKAKLNIDISTSSPVFIEGSWGRAYAEGEISVGGTVEKPIVNGKVRINYGKVFLMKNIYNIDFLNIKITNNDVYVNGRLSTLVSGVNVFVNVSGPSKNLKYEFFSTPPKSKEEILTLLLLKKSPEQIASTGLFGMLGKIGEMLIPFKVEEEEKGIFGTGVNVNIIPTYSPVQGIVFSVYMQKYLTRRIYIGLSRPLSQYQIVNYVGWYEGGVRLSERSYFVIKSFENKTRSAEITFTLPFDF